MAKKSRRQRQTSSKKKRRAVEKPVEVQPEMVKGDLSEEYHYVVEDLARIGIIAAVLVAGLIALSFFI